VILWLPGEPASGRADAFFVPWLRLFVAGFFSTAYSDRIPKKFEWRAFGAALAAPIDDLHFTGS
jgi:hypothetical protein